MDIHLKYGKTEIPLSFSGREFPVIGSEAYPALPEEKLLKRLLSLVPEGKRLGIIVPDGTRPLPVARLLDMLEPRLEGREVTIFIGTGTHRLMTDEELKKHLGRWAGRFPVRQNTVADVTLYKPLGITTRGTPVAFRREAMELDALLGLTLVRPHYYAGFSGGRKIFLPGIASKATIQGNHSLVLEKDPSKGKNPKAVLGLLEENPVHQDMLEAVTKVPIPVSLAHGIMQEGRVVDILDSFDQAVARVRSVFEKQAREKYDALVISSGGVPYDVNFIQGHKAMENAVGGLKPGGALYASMECPEGFGSRDCLDFLKLGTVEAIVRKLREDFKVYGHTALTILLKSKKFRIHLHSALSDEHIRLMGFTPWDGKTLPDLPPRTAIIPQGGAVYFPQGT